MRYAFRGYSAVRKVWITGDGIDQSDNLIKIHSNTAGWVYVMPKTVGRKIILKDKNNTEVYQGDILRYSFKQGSEFYNKYYKVCENTYEVWAEELWRDYELDCETFEVTRFHNTKFVGVRKDIDTFDLTEPVTVVGTIWHNPELL
jgi:hypothetical protein